MAQVQSGRATGPNIRRTPVVHDESLQEAKRLEKMQTVCSSHRVSGSASLPGGLAKAAPST